MARIRSVHPGLASDESFMSMSMPAKAGWPLLWTECDDAGVFEWKPIVLKARIFPADNVDFTALLAEYESLGCIKRAEAGGKPYGVIRNFCRYQRPKNPSYRFPEELRDPDYTGFKSPDDTKAPPALPQDGVKPTENPPQRKEEGGSKEVALSNERASRAKRKEQGHKCPPDFAAGENHFDWAAERGLPRTWVNAEADRMKRWSHENGHREIARKVDWSSALFSWMDKAIERLPGKTGTGPPQRKSAATMFNEAFDESPQNADHSPSLYGIAGGVQPASGRPRGPVLEQDRGGSWIDARDDFRQARAIGR